LSTIIPQLGPAMALVQLLQAHPELHPLDWRITPDGQLGGSLVNDGIDGRAVMAPYAAALDAEPSEFTYVSKSSGTARFSSTIFGTWRDIPFYVQVSCAASSVAQHGAVAA
jgi:hypothetical protein